MKVRWIGVALVLAVAAGALGYRLGTERTASPAAFTADPVPASSPSHPVIPAVIVADDPAAALAPAVGVRRQTVGSPPFQVRLPIPRGWVRSEPNVGEWKWYPSWQLTSNAYFVKVLQIGNDYRSIDAAVRIRIADLDSAASVTDLEVEREPDRFAASYVSDQHRRFSYEGYLSRPGSGAADVYVAVIGREVDRPGLEALFDRLMSETDLT
jgi:hypothetical protein